MKKKAAFIDQRVIVGLISEPDGTFRPNPQMLEDFQRLRMAGYTIVIIAAENASEDVNGQYWEKQIRLSTGLDKFFVGKAPEVFRAPAEQYDIALESSCFITAEDDLPSAVQRILFPSL